MHNKSKLRRTAREKKRLCKYKTKERKIAKRMRNYDFCLVHCSQLEQNKTNGNEQQEQTQEKKTEIQRMQKNKFEMKLKMMSTNGAYAL